MLSTRKSLTTAAAAGAVIALLGAAPAHAEVRTGWIGGSPPIDGTVYLHTSTIDNGGVPIGSSRIYTSFGNVVNPGTMGAKARLFREGALCSATDYRFNAFLTNSQNTATTRDCGAGWYNSHGFVAVLGSNGAINEYVTFPTDPLQYPPGTAAEPSAAAFADESGANSRGQTYGGAAEINNDSELPDLVAAFGSNLQQGYVKASDLRADPSNAEQSPSIRVVPLMSREGEEIGKFEIGS
ncbi:hypothetical protein ACIO14_25590 [Nocardia fluminea]|uniref:hypothetical protein n=1 Tax=Nocardia fluminea TaxID=134984 RepID=UPI003800C9F0